MINKFIDPSQRTFTWILILYAYVSLLLALIMPELAIAAGEDSPYGPPKELKGDLNAAGESWWDTIAGPGMLVSILAAVLLYITNYTQYMRIAAVALLIFAWGDDIGRYLLSMGGTDI